MLTSSAAAGSKPGIGDVVLREWEHAGLGQPSVVRAGRLLVIEHRLLTAGLGRLSDGDLAAVDRALKDALGLS